MNLKKLFCLILLLISFSSRVYASSNECASLFEEISYSNIDQLAKSFVEASLNLQKDKNLIIFEKLNKEYKQHIQGREDLEIYFDHKVKEFKNALSEKYQRKNKKTKEAMEIKDQQLEKETQLYEIERKALSVFSPKEIFTTQIKRNSLKDVTSKVSPTAKYIETLHGKTRQIYEVSTGKIINQFDQVNTLKFSLDEKFILIIRSDDNRFVKVYDVVNGVEIFKTPDLGLNFINHAEFSPDGKHLLIQPTHGPPKIYEITTGKEILHPFLSEKVKSVRYSSNGNYLSIVSKLGKDGAFYVYELASGKEVLKIKNSLTDGPFDVKVHDFGSSQNEKYVLVSSTKFLNKSYHNSSQELKLFELASGREVFKAESKAVFLSGFNSYSLDPLKKISISPDEKYLLTVSTGRIVKAYEIATGLEILNVSEMFDAGFSPDGKYIATISNINKTVTFYETSKGDVTTYYIDSKAYNASFDVAGKHIELDLEDGTIHLIRVYQTLEEIERM